MPSNIYLVGMMGSGKTVVGRMLALLLKTGFVDIDELICQQTRRTISEIFSKEGEEFFRNQESLILEAVSAAGPRVIATGGGSILRPSNVQRMRETGKIVYLETSLGELWERVKEKSDRPLLAGGEPDEALKKIFSVRKPLYEQICDVKILTDGQNIETLAHLILKKIG